MKMIKLLRSMSDEFPISNL